MGIDLPYQLVNSPKILTNQTLFSCMWRHLRSISNLWKQLWLTMVGPGLAVWRNFPQPRHLEGVSEALPPDTTAGNKNTDPYRDPITETENGFMEPKYLEFRRWLYTPCSSSDEVVVLTGHVHSRKPRCPLEKGPFWWKDSSFLRGVILISSFSGKQKSEGGNVTTSKLESWIFWNQRTVPVPVVFFSDGWHVWSSRTVTLAYFLGSFAPHHFPPHSWCIRPFGRMFCWQTYQFRYVWVDITWRFFILTTWIE